jgi:hypothetical protein
MSSLRLVWHYRAHWCVHTAFIFCAQIFCKMNQHHVLQKNLTIYVLEQFYKIMFCWTLLQYHVLLKDITISRFAEESQHTGQLDTGHYTCFVRRDSAWYVHAYTDAHTHTHAHAHAHTYTDIDAHAHIAYRHTHTHTHTHAHTPAHTHAHTHTHTHTHTRTHAHTHRFYINDTCIQRTTEVHLFSLISAILTVLLHCCYTDVTLLLRFSYTGVCYCLLCILSCRIRSWREYYVCLIFVSHSQEIALTAHAYCLFYVRYALLLHCCYTVVTLLLRFCYTVLTLLWHNRHTLVTLCLHCCCRHTRVCVSINTLLQHSDHTL